MDSDDTLTPGQYNTYRHWRMAAENVDACLNRMLAKDELSMAELRVLIILNDAPEMRLRMSDLASDANHSPSRSSHTITRMEARGWVKRLPHETDRRVIYVTLTTAGKALYDKVSPRYRASVKRWFVEAIGAEHVEAFDQDMMRVIAATNYSLTPGL